MSLKQMNFTDKKGLTSFYFFLTNYIPCVYEKVIIFAPDNS